MTKHAPHSADPGRDDADILNVLEATDRLNNTRHIVAGIRMAAESLDGVGDQERAALCTLADMAIDGMIEIRDQLDRYRYCAHRAGGAA